MQQDRLKTLDNKIGEVFRSLDSPENQYVCLWREVVSRAIWDAIGSTGISDKELHDKTVREARRWFKFSEEYEDIFEMAGVEPNPIIKEVFRIKPTYYDEGE